MAYTVQSNAKNVNLFISLFVLNYLVFIFTTTTIVGFATKLANAYCIAKNVREKFHSIRARYAVAFNNLVNP